DLEAAADGEVVAHAVFGCAQGELGSSGKMLDAVDTHRMAVAHVDGSLCAGHGNHSGLVEPHAEAAASLDGGGRLVVADKAVGEAVRWAVGGTAPADTEVRASRSAEVLERAADPLIDDLDHV